jgi:two-component system nitrogen regulation response regulator NtrX
MSNNTILIIDDEADIRDLTSDILSEEGFDCIAVSNSLSAFEAINKKMPSVVLLDIWLQGSEMDGLGILEILKQRYVNLPVIMISGHGNVETAVSSIKIGAYDYLEKPFSSEKLVITVKRAYETLKLKKENIELRKKIVSKLEFIGSSEKVITLKSIIDKVAQTSGRILISGEPGVGKELVARIIHKKSKRNSNPFVTINASLLGDESVSAELFGEYKNSENSKYSSSVFELAKKGTLFIDEVADIPIPIQKKILKILKKQSVDDFNQNEKLDARIIASTSKDLVQEIKNGNFLQELYFRLNVIGVEIPPLKNRVEDIPLLCEYFLKYFEKTLGFTKKTMGTDTVVAMQKYHWPGNIRQLKNTIEWMLIMSSKSYDSVIRASALPHDITFQDESDSNRTEIKLDMLALPLREAREIFERKYLIAQMARFNQNISKTSSFVGMERSALHRKLKALALNCSDDINDKDINEENIESSFISA